MILWSLSSGCAILCLVLATTDVTLGMGVLIAACASLLVALAGYVQARTAAIRATEAATKSVETHVAVNSRMDKFLSDQAEAHKQLILLAEKTAHAAGVRQAEIAAEHDKAVAATKEISVMKELEKEEKEPKRKKSS